MPPVIRDIELDPNEYHMHGLRLWHEKRYKDAVCYFQTAAEAGIVGSQNDLACSYEDGLGVSSPNRLLAVYWFACAASSGCEIALYNLQTVSDYLIKDLHTLKERTDLDRDLEKKCQGFFSDYTIRAAEEVKKATGIILGIEPIERKTKSVRWAEPLEDNDNLNHTNKRKKHNHNSNGFCL